MNTKCTWSLLASALVLAALGLFSRALAQNKPSTTNGRSTPLLEVLPRFIKFSGELSPQIREMMQVTPGESGNTGQSRIITIAFSLYESQQGGAPLWAETQNVEVDEHGRFTVLLGAASPDGLPLDLFATARARWLAAQPQLPGAGEQSRVALVGVPYALKAADADTLGGKPASAYVTTNVRYSASSTVGQGEASTNSATQAHGLSQPPGAKTAIQSPAARLSLGGSGTTNDIPIWTTSSTLGNSALTQVSGKVGLGTKTPATTFDVRSTANALQALTSGATGIGVLGNATSTAGANFGVQGTSASSSGVGVLGNESSTGSSSCASPPCPPYGVEGKSASPGGVGVFGNETANSGHPVGVFGQVFSSVGTAAVFNNQAGGEVLRGQIGGVDKFSFDKDGNLVLMNGDLNLTKGGVMFSDGSEQNAAAPVKITAGPGLSGGGKADASGNVTLNLDTAFTDARYLKLTGGTLTGALIGTTGDFAATSSEDGVSGSSDSGSGMFGISDSGSGVFGDSTSGVGVEGESTDSDGVKGTSATKGGVVGESTSGDGVAGVACSGSCGGAAVFGVGHLAGAFQGNVGVTGNLSVTGVKVFHIDHPLDPANKYLNHFCMESNEVLNAYSGNVTTDLRGTATVILPAYFSALNVNYRYQLTVIGQFAQAIVFKEIEHNNFVIKTDKPSVKVSWQVTGVRNDPSVRNYALPVEEAKPQRERGYYLHPEFFGQPEEKSVMWLYHGGTIRDAKALRSPQTPTPGERGARPAPGRDDAQALGRLRRNRFLNVQHAE